MFDPRQPRDKLGQWTSGVFGMTKNALAPLARRLDIRQDAQPGGKRIEQVPGVVDSRDNNHHVSYNRRNSFCYVYSGKFIQDNHDIKNAKLVHGFTSISPNVPEINHSWVEMGNKVFEPNSGHTMTLSEFNKFFHPKREVSYTREEFLMHRRNSKHWGPWHEDEVSKANILWDGDGLQGAGQPRDRMGRWVRLPGPSQLKSIGAFELEDGTVGIFHNDSEVPTRTLKSKSRANQIVAEAIKEDVDLYKKNQRSAARIRRKGSGPVNQRIGHNVTQEEVDAALRNRYSPVPEKGRAAKQPGKASRRVEADTMARLPVPGRPTQDQVNRANKWARDNMPEAEAKYAGLITRLLKNRGVTQDPALRGEMSERYNVPSGRLIEIEQAVYDQMFPQKAAGAKKVPNLAGASPNITTQQKSEMLKHGARKGIALSAEENLFRPERMFKATKGPNRGKWMKVGWSGTPTVMSDKEAAEAHVKAKVFWTEQALMDAKGQQRRREQRQKEQAELMEAHKNNVAQQKAQKIAFARAWARDQGYDENDSYWWAFYWGDNSLLKKQDEETTVQMQVNLGPVTERQHMDPKLLEGLLALPEEFDTRQMRGHRPEGRRSKKGDEDFVEADETLRSDAPEWESRNQDRRMVHARRAKAAYDRFKTKNPKSKLTFEQFKDKYYNNKLRIPGGARDVSKSNPRWDGDGRQGIGQPRDRRGRWSDTGLGSLGSVLDLGDRMAPKHTGTATRRAGAKVPSVFDARNKTLAPDQKIKRPQKGSQHNQHIGDVPVKRKKHHKPEEAYYLRNNGTTKISDKRLGEIFQDRSKITPAEFDMISSAAGDIRYDGDSKIAIMSVRAGGARRMVERYMLIKNLRTALAQDFAKEKGLTRKGAGGQVLIHGDKDTRAVAQREKDNKKRALNQRNKVNQAVRHQMLEDFGNGKTAKCIFCGKPVDVQEVSPERMKPGPIGGAYDRGNMAPAHVSCNTAVGHLAQHDPEKYYADMMGKFMKVYGPEIRKGRLGFVFTKHRKALAGKRPPVGRK